MKSQTDASIPEPSTHAAGPHLGDSIVVVSGLPRSGTSMLMRMLAAGGVPLLIDDVRAADEDNPHGYFEFTPVKALNKPGDKQWLGAARGKGIKIISFLLPHLPDSFHYKIIFIRRRLPEVPAPQRKMLQRRGEPTDKTPDAAMAGMFEAHLAQVQRLLAAKPNCEVLYLDHRQAIEEPATVVASIDRFLGGGLDTAAMSAEIDTSLHRNRA